MYRILGLVFLLISQMAIAQNTTQLSLNECYQSAATNYPVAKLKEYNQSATALKLKNLQANWLPVFELGGQATYQSDVTKIDITIPIPGFSIPTPNQEQYKATLDIRQTLYDGGATALQRKMEEADLSVENQNVEVQLYQLKEQVNRAFFSVLVFEETAKQLQLTLDDLNSRLKIVESGVANGVLLPIEADRMKAEIIKLQQQQIEIKLSRKSSIEVLQELTGKVLTDLVLLQMPVFNSVMSNDFNRPEFKLFDYQKQKLDLAADMTRIKLMPKVGAFAQLGYGNPGLNMLNDEFDSYYLVGARVTWTPWDWRNSSRERQVFAIKQQSVDVQRDALTTNLTINQKRLLSEIEKLETLIQKDDEIIALRQKITKAAASQLENGVITATEYITELNAENQARIKREVRKVQLLMNRADYNVVTGLD